MSTTTPVTQPVSQPVSQPSPAYDDSATVAELSRACREAGGHLERIARRALQPAPSLHFDEQPPAGPKPTITVSQAAARLASAIYVD